MKKVLVMMDCYNGEAYISKQLESICKQSYRDWSLFIQDDGSSDKTVDIVNSFCQMDNRIRLFVNNSNYHGAFINFHSLANRAKEVEKYDYYMFCDQDDIWDENKIATMVSEMETKKVEDTPSLLYADMRLIDKEDRITEQSIDSIWRISGKNNYSYFFSHKVFGCNMIMNSKLFFKVPIIDISDSLVSIVSHDNLYAKFAATFGNVYYIKQPLMSYRRHGDNQTSEQKYKMSIRRIADRLFNLDDLAQRHAITYTQTLYAIQLMNEFNLNTQQSDVLKNVVNIIHRGGITSFLLSVELHVVWGSLIENASHQLILLLGLHKKYLRIKGT
jgi:rhamnosyltransferase